MIEIPAAIEPTEWFIVFHRKSMNRWLSLLAFGEFKHVSAFAYCPGLKVWLIYDVQWSGTRHLLVDIDSIKAWVAGCEVVKIARGTAPMGMSARLGLYCVTAIKHLIRLRCVAPHPDGLYRHILRNGGTSIAGDAANPGRSEPRDRAAAGPEQPDLIAANADARG
jgi:hypothetical protein